MPLVGLPDEVFFIIVEVGRFGAIDGLRLRWVSLFSSNTIVAKPGVPSNSVISDFVK